MNDSIVIICFFSIITITISITIAIDFLVLYQILLVPKIHYYVFTKIMSYYENIYCCVYVYSYIIFLKMILIINTNTTTSLIL